MGEDGLDVTSATPTLLTDELAHEAQIIVTMGCGEECPIVPGARRLDWNVSDPHGADLPRVRAIRDEIRMRVVRLLADEGLLSDGA